MKYAKTNNNNKQKTLKEPFFYWLCMIIYIIYFLNYRIPSSGIFIYLFLFFGNLEPLIIQ